MPDFTSRDPVEIVTEDMTFDSTGFVYRGLSWLDYAKRHASVSALQYAAIDTRQAIEQLLFEEIVMSVGGQLERKEYERCKGNGTKLAKVIRKLNSDYEQLVAFTTVIASLLPNSPPLVIWDFAALLKHWGAVSTYLHWMGAPAETFESPQWLKQGLETVEHAATYLWKNMTKGYSGVMLPEKMQPEIRQAWIDFKSGNINLDSVRERARIALPVLSARMGL
jgi:hypothetical protein